MEGPASVRNAMRVIIAATAFMTIVGGLVIWLADRNDFKSVGDAMWWALQTVTTVGYGDVTPKSGVGRVIGSAVLLYAIAFLSILTAVITTTFLESARREREGRLGIDAGDAKAVLERLDEIMSRLDHLEHRLDERNGDERAGRPGG